MGRIVWNWFSRSSFFCECDGNIYLSWGILLFLGIVNVSQPYFIVYKDLFDHNYILNSVAILWFPFAISQFLLPLWRFLRAVLCSILSFLDSFSSRWRYTHFGLQGIISMSCIHELMKHINEGFLKTLLFFFLFFRLRGWFVKEDWWYGHLLFSRLIHVGFGCIHFIFWGVMVCTRKVTVITNAKVFNFRLWGIHPIRVT